MLNPLWLNQLILGLKQGLIEARGSLVGVGAGGTEEPPRTPGFGASPGSPHQSLCDLGQVFYSLWAAASSSLRE